MPIPIRLFSLSDKALDAIRLTMADLIGKEDGVKIEGRDAVFLMEDPEEVVTRISVIGHPEVTRATLGSLRRRIVKATNG